MREKSYSKFCMTSTTTDTDSGSTSSAGTGNSRKGSSMGSSSRQYFGLKGKGHGAGKAGTLLSPDFLTYCFKVTPCNRKYPHDWASCLCGHKGERATRRDLRTHSYLPIACEYAKQKLECPRGDACAHSHNLFEYWLHPKRYKTEWCLFRSNCDRPVCFFAHNIDELRQLEEGLPPAEVCWSAGAALNSKQRAQLPHNSTSTKQQQDQQQQQSSQLQQQGSGQQQQQPQQQMIHDVAAQQQQSAVYMQMPSGELVLLPGVHGGSNSSSMAYSQPVLQQQPQQQPQQQQFQQRVVMLAPASQALSANLPQALPMSTMPAAVQQLPAQQQLPMQGMHHVAAAAAAPHSMPSSGLPLAGSSQPPVTLPMAPGLAHAGTVTAAPVWQQHVQQVVQHPAPQFMMLSSGFPSLQQQQQRPQQLMQVGGWGFGSGGNAVGSACTLPLSLGPVTTQGQGSGAQHHSLLLSGMNSSGSNAGAAAACGADPGSYSSVATPNSLASNASSSNSLAGLMLSSALSAGMQPGAAAVQLAVTQGLVSSGGRGVTSDMSSLLSAFQGVQLAVTQA